jgi:putative FmdB family regulatory protein
MPMYNYMCPACAFQTEHLVPSRDSLQPCDRCGHSAMERMASMPNVIADSVPGGFVIENLDKVPRRFYSKSEYRDELAARGLKTRDHHVPRQDSDKNPNCAKWY